ncbi:hypothetical protein N7467_001758 [Penicillium canescens]|nr:hypothetical protein N7467_001758 [Penicillium canescens]
MDGRIIKKSTQLGFCVDQRKRKDGTNKTNGGHQQALTDSEFIALWKLLLAHFFIYSATVTSTKCSIDVLS